MDTITADEIKEIRGQYGLTQKAFAQLLGLGSASIVRYEQGVTPSKANANLIRAARHPEFVLECIERDGDLISEQQRNNATQCIYALISLEPEESSAKVKEMKVPDTELTEMDRVYHYTLQQEVLNEQAANIIGEIISIKTSTGVKGKACDVIDSLLDQICEIKPTIVSSDSEDDVILSQIRGYLSCANDLINRYKLRVAR